MGFRVDRVERKNGEPQTNNPLTFQPTKRKPSDIQIPIGGNQGGCYIAVNNTNKLPGLLNGTEKC